MTRVTRASESSSQGQGPQGHKSPGKGHQGRSQARGSDEGHKITKARTTGPRVKVTEARVARARVARSQGLRPHGTRVTRPRKGSQEQRKGLQEIGSHDGHRVTRPRATMGSEKFTRPQGLASQGHEDQGHKVRREGVVWQGLWSQSHNTLGHKS
eukprot:7406502-Pyramimonas_sp.AAC.1